MLAMTSNTLGDAISFFARYVELRGGVIRLHATTQNDFLLLSFVNDVPTSLRGFFAESTFTMLTQIARLLIGHSFAAHCEMSFREPSHHRRFQHLLPGTVSFDAPINALRAQRALLDASIVTADSVAARRMARECQTELELLRRAESAVDETLRRLRDAKEIPSLEVVAQWIGQSARTLKRRLADEGSNFRVLVDTVRKERTLALLQTSRPLDVLAADLGYTDVASFHRAFKRWFGATPGAYRPKR